MEDPAPDSGTGRGKRSYKLKNPGSVGDPTVIYVCIPARNEAATLGPLLWKVAQVMRDFGRELQLVVLDDGSTDDTADVLGRYEKVLPLTVLREEESRGYGAAVDRLLRHTVEASDYPKRDAAVVLQGDLTDDPSYLMDLVKTLEGGVDVVSGAAPDPGPELPRALRWGRRLAPYALGAAYRTAPVEDPLCGLRAYRIIVLKKALREDEAPLASAPEPWVANVELLQRLTRFARRVETLPVTLRYHLLVRESRFRAVHTLKRLFTLRSSPWDSPGGDTSRDRERAA